MIKKYWLIFAALALAGIYLLYTRVKAAGQLATTAGYLWPDMTPLDISGGLFPGGSNAPGATQALRIQEATTAITPRDANGNPAADGFIGVLAAGASNPVTEWNAFTDLAIGAEETNENLIFVNGCIGAVSIEDMNSGTSPVGDYFARLADACQDSGITAAQVQVIWFKSDCLSDVLWSMTPEEYTAYFADQFTITLQKMYANFPNLAIVYTSGRNNPYIEEGQDTYTRHGGPRACLNQRGYKEVMNRQNTGAAELTPYGADKIAPVLTWSTPLFTEPRGEANSYGHIWEPGDVIGDGLHPTEAGEAKVAALLFDFFSTDEQAKKWFIG